MSLDQIKDKQIDVNIEMQLARVKSAQIQSPKIQKQYQRDSETIRGNINAVNEMSESNKQNMVIACNIDRTKHFRNEHIVKLKVGNIHFQQDQQAAKGFQDQQATKGLQDQQATKRLQDQQMSEQSLKQLGSGVEQLFSQSQLQSFSCCFKQNILACTESLLTEQSSHTQKLTQNNTVDYQTVTPFTNNISQTLSNICEPLLETNKNFTQADDEQLISLSSKDYSHSICFQCDITKIQTRKQLINKQIELQNKYWTEKQLTKKYNNQKYNELYQNIKQKDQIITILHIQNQEQTKTIVNYQNTIKNTLKMHKKTIANKNKQMELITQQLTSLHAQNVQKMKQKYESKVQNVQEQISKLKKQNIQLIQQSNQKQQKLKLKLLQQQEQHQQTIKNLKKHYELKFKLSEQRQNSQMQTIKSHHMIERQSLQLQHQSYQQIIAVKDDLIANMLLTIEQLTSKGQQQQQTFRFENLINRDNMQSNVINEIKCQFQQQLNTYVKHMEMKEQQMRLMCQSKIYSLQRINSIYEAMLMKRRTKIDSLDSQILNTELLNQETITQQQISTITQKKLLKEIKILKQTIQSKQKDQTNKQKQLSLLQQIIQNLYKQLQQAQINIEQQQQQFNKQIKIIKQSLSLQRSAYNEIRNCYERQNQQKQAQIQYLKKYIQENNVSQQNKMCERIKCVRNHKQKETLIQQNTRLKQQMYKMQSNYKSQFQQMLKQRKQSFCQIEQKTQKRIDQMITKIKLQFDTKIEELKQSYQKILKQKGQQISQLTFMISGLTQINFQLYKNTNLCQQELKSIQRKFQELLVNLMTNVQNQQ